MLEPRITARQKAEVKRRAKNCCEYCWSQEAFSPDVFSVEHLKPLARGGNNSLANLANACQGCNNRKYISVEALDPLTGDLVSLYHPRQHIWAEHFAWNEDFSLIIGLSPIGRATTAKLELNRTGVVNLRKLLNARGLHPVEM